MTKSNAQMTELSDKNRSRLKMAAIVCASLMVAGLVVFLGLKAAPYDVDVAASRVGRKLEKRMAELDGYIARAADGDRNALLRFDSFPEDFVLYRYVNDSLQSWCNQFCEANDDISTRLIFPRLTNYPDRLDSPLNRVRETPLYMSIGSGWYLVKSVRVDRDVRIIAGIEIKNTVTERNISGSKGVNPQLRLKGKYDIVPLAEDAGSVVDVGDEPVFKVIRDGDWSLKREFSHNLFSPIVYADGPFFSSLGALILINLSLILLLTVSLLFRRKIIWRIYGAKSGVKRNLLIYSGVILLVMVLVTVYTFLSLQSLSDNSEISLEFFRWPGRAAYSVTVFLSYIILMLLTWFQTYCFRPIIKELTKLNFNPLSTGWLIAFSFITASFLTVTSIFNGLRKEENRVWTWADRLAIDRDISLELQLISVEDAIASDQVISSLIPLDNSDRILYNRISDSYFGRFSQIRDINVLVVRDSDRRMKMMFDAIIAGSTPIAPGSHFLYNDSSDGQNSYFGIFMYYVKGQGLTRMVIQIPNNPDTDRYGYRSLLRAGTRPGELSIPPFYSYAKYYDSRLKTYHGGYTPYPYPTVYTGSGENFDEAGHTTVKSGGYTHFFTRLDNDETIVISRPSRKFTAYFTSFSFIFLSLFLISLLFRRDPRRGLRGRKPSLLKAKINALIISALVLTMTAIVVVSVVFVYERNETNLKNLMTGRINTMQALVEKRCQYAAGYEDLMNLNFTNELIEIGLITKTDISLFTPGGKVFVSTDPEVFERMIVGSRLDQDAYYSITRLNQRYFIHKEKFADRTFYSLYAPIFNSRGTMVAIACCPYTDRNFDFSQEAVLHASLITCLFFMLLLVSIYVSSLFTDTILSNLTKLGRKMDQVDIHNLKTISYKGNDEVSSLVEAYNKMVGVLGESTKRLAQAERDNAWSEMARQAAHEIKNSLTPIKLKIQKLIRLKRNGTDNWDEKFEETAAVILEHIDILAETASGFSAIAKLSTEEPVPVNLDRIINEQILIFDNRENIRFTYMGLDDSFVTAPQSQLIRVFINLITNAIQAIEIRQREESAQGREPAVGKIVICIRNSGRDGFYDVTVDDNGTGVKPEDVDRLFVPNFTTKTSGTGLGLSICRSIIESCDGTINYSRSFALGGACFTVSLPRR